MPGTSLTSSATFEKPPVLSDGWTHPVPSVQFLTSLSLEEIQLYLTYNVRNCFLKRHMNASLLSAEAYRISVFPIWCRISFHSSLLLRGQEFRFISGSLGLLLSFIASVSFLFTLLARAPLYREKMLRHRGMGSHEPGEREHEYSSQLPSQLQMIQPNRRRHKAFEDTFGKMNGGR